MKNEQKMYNTLNRMTEFFQHRDPDLMAQRIKDHLLTQLDILQGLPQEDLLAKRFQRLMSYGN